MNNEEMAKVMKSGPVETAWAKALDALRTATINVESIDGKLGTLIEEGPTHHRIPDTTEHILRNVDAAIHALQRVRRELSHTCVIEVSKP